MSVSFNPFDVVGVASGASLEEIKAAFRSRALTLHPDKGGDPEKFRRLQEAYEILKRDFNPDGSRRGFTTGSDKTYVSRTVKVDEGVYASVVDFEEFFKEVFRGSGVGTPRGVGNSGPETPDEYFARVRAAQAKTSGEPAKKPQEPPPGYKPPSTAAQENVARPSSRSPENTRNYESQSAQAAKAAESTKDWKRKYEEGRQAERTERVRQRTERETKEQADRAKRLKRAQEQAERYRRRAGTIHAIEDALRWLADFNAQVTFTERGPVVVQIWVDRPRPCIVQEFTGDEKLTDPAPAREIFYAFDRTMVDARGPNLLEATRVAALDAMRYTAL